MVASHSVKVCKSLFVCLLAGVSILLVLYKTKLYPVDKYIYMLFFLWTKILKKVSACCRTCIYSRYVCFIGIKKFDI